MIQAGAAILVAALALVAMSPAQAGDTPALSALMQKACIDTGMQREAFEQLARAERWRSVSPRPTFRQTGWSLAYRVAPHTLMLSRIATDNDAAAPDVGTLCTLMTAQPPSGWHDDVVRFAAAQGLQPEPVPDMPRRMAPMEIWGRFRGYTLTAAYVTSPANLSLSLSRQIVIDSPSQLAPTGL